MAHDPSPRLHYEVHDGRGPYLLLVHGYLSSRAQWLPNLAALGQVCRPVVVELWGHGRSPAPDDPSLYHPDAYLEQFEALRRRLGAERWAICGQSLGAALTLRYALACPERVLAQVFTNSNSALAEEGWEERVRPLMEAQARLLLRDGRRAMREHPLSPTRGSRLPPEVREALVADLSLHDPRGVAWTGLYTVPPSSVRGRIGQNRVPSLLVVGEREERFQEHRRYAEAHMPLLEVVALPAGHAVNLEAAAAFDAAVVRFLARFL
jgi:pimeloyl-ACP methyl ester carboxylesterase